VSAASRRWGLRREAPILLPAALVIFAILALITLALYRSAVERFALERQSEALALAERWASEPGRPGAERLEALGRALPLGSALAVVDAEGRAVAAAGALPPPPPPPELLAAARAGHSASAGPESTSRPAVVALVPLAGGASRALLLELPALALAGQQRTLALLTPLVVTLSALAAIVVTLYLVALLRPYEALLERARAAAGHEGDAAPDEMEFLLATFDRALAALGTPKGDLAPLAGALGGALDGGFVLLDPEGRTWAMTPAAAELLGVAAPVAGTPLAAALAGHPSLAHALETAIRAGQPVARATVREARGGRELALDVTAEPLRGEGRILRGWLIVLADSTEKVRSEHRERLAEGLAQLGELSAGVAHELRNGLAAVSGWVELARRRRPDPETDSDLVEIERECRQLTRVVSDFLAFARPGTRRLEPCDLIAILRRAAPAAGLGPEEWTLAPAPAAAELRGDAQLLERAFRNLLANAGAARRAAAAAPPVELSVAPAAGGWTVGIADRGAGIPAAVRARLFEPFVSGRDDGVGLGLALARRIFVLHGGAVSARDRAGGGTLFEVLLPSDTSDTQSNETGL